MVEACWQAIRKRVESPASRLPHEDRNLDVGLGLAETLHAVAGLPLAALLQDIDALEALENVAFHDEAGDALEAFML
jgi:hypothetical protein